MSAVTTKGQNMPKRHHSALHKADLYASHDERRKMEHMDAGMISDDRSSMANMPQGVIMKEYPKIHGYMPEHLDDTERGIEHQIDQDNAQKNRHMAPKKV